MIPLTPHIYHVCFHLVQKWMLTGIHEITASQNNSFIPVLIPPLVKMAVEQTRKAGSSKSSFHPNFSIGLIKDTTSSWQPCLLYVVQGIGEWIFLTIYHCYGKFFSWDTSKFFNQGSVIYQSHATAFNNQMLLLIKNEKMSKGSRKEIMLHWLMLSNQH